MRRSILLAAAALALPATPASAQDRAPPYWASIAATQAIMRAGPDRSYPATWIYQRRDLPVKVVQVNGPWRRVVEQDGTTGWMLAMLLSARRTAIVTGGTQTIRESADASSRLLWQAEAGVVGRISRCDGQFCRFQIGDRSGFVEQAGLWGVERGETVK